MAGVKAENNKPVVFRFSPREHLRPANDGGTTQKGRELTPEDCRRVLAVRTRCFPVDLMAILGRKNTVKIAMSRGRFCE
jgi:hypothetical protein